MGFSLLHCWNVEALLRSLCILHRLHLSHTWPAEFHNSDTCLPPPPQAHAAIESVGVPPQMYGVAVQHSAYGGINITEPDSLVQINNCTVQQNAGTSSSGRLL